MSASKFRSRRSARRVAIGKRHEGHSFLPMRMDVSMHSLQKRCKHSVAVGARMMLKQMGHESERSSVSAPPSGKCEKCHALVIISR